MTITATNDHNGPFTGTGATNQVFPFTFHAASADEIEVLLDDVIVNPSYYSVSLNGDSTGSVTATLSGEVYIRSRPNFTQDAAWERYAPYFPDQFNAPLDRAAQRDIWLKGQVDRAIRAPFGPALSDLPVERSSGILGFDTTGDLEIKTAQQIVDAATIAVSVSAAGVTSVTSTALLAALTEMTDGQEVYVSQAGYQGWFRFNTDDLSADVAADTYQGLTIAPASAPSGASGAWERLVGDDATYCLSWFGFSVANVATAHLRWQALEALLVSRGVPWARRILPVGTFTGFAPGLAASTSGVYLKTPGEVRGAGNLTVLDPNATYTGQGALIDVLASDIEVSHLKFARCQSDPATSDAFLCINVGSRHSAGASAAVATDRISLHDLWFDDCDNPIRAIRNQWASGVFTVPTKLDIYNIRITDCGYQAIVPWCDQVNIHDFDIQMKAGVTPRAFTHAFRILAAKSVRVSNGRIHDDMGINAFGIMRGGVDSTGNLYGAQYGEPEDIHISDVKMTGIGSAFRIYETTGLLTIANCSYRGNVLATTGEGTPFTFGHDAPMRNGQIVVQGGFYAGFNSAAYFANGNYKRVVFKDVLFVGNDAASHALDGVVQVDNAGTDALGAAKTGVRMLEIDGCRFLFKDSLFSFGVAITSAVAGSWFSLRNSVMPYNISANDIVQTSGAAGTVDGNATNRTYPAGLFAEQITNFATNPRTGEY